MKKVTLSEIQSIKRAKQDSHKGQNGKLLVIGGSTLFHSASLWSLTVASRIVDLVHYSSVKENNEIVAKSKQEFRNGIVIERQDIESYIKEDDCILIGPGMVRSDKTLNEYKDVYKSIKDINELADEGEQTFALTNYLLKKYPHKQWVIDAGALQMIDIRLIPKNAILTPHKKELEGLWKKYISLDKKNKIDEKQELTTADKVTIIVKAFACTILLKGAEDIACIGESCCKDGCDSEKGVCAPAECRIITGGNEGMTKGGTGDVLAGLIASLYCTNDAYISTIAGSYINKKAGEELYKRVGPYFNASDLAEQIPITMKTLFY